LLAGKQLGLEVLIGIQQGMGFKPWLGKWEWVREERGGRGVRREAM